MAGLFGIPLRPLLTAYLLGLAGFVCAQYSIHYALGSFRVSIHWAFLFPLLASMAYGPKYALVAGALGLGAFYPFTLWPNNGWANIPTVLLLLVWFAWQGWCAARRRGKPAWWNHPFVAQIFYCALFAILIFGLYPVLFPLNPPPWNPAADIFIPASVLEGIVFKELILTYLAVLVASALLKSNGVRRLLGLPVPSWARYNDKIISVSLLGAGVVSVFHRALTGILIARDFPAGLFRIREPQNLIDFLILICIGFTTAYVVCLIMETRCRAEDRLAQSREQLRSTLLSMDDLVFTLDSLGRITQYHRPKAWIDGTAGEGHCAGRPYGECLPMEFRRALEPIMGKVLAGGATEALEYSVAAGGETRWYSAKVSCHRAPASGENGLTVVARDVTAGKQMEEHLRHSQKMQAIGTLAGGIAHDFNNIIAPIAVLAGVAEQNAGDPEKLSEALGRIRKAATRARELTQQILSFGRKTASGLSPVVVAPVLRECMKLLRANIPPEVEVRLEIRSDAAVMGDSVQVFQVIMNLCTNAFQAMERRGGVLTVSLVDGPGEAPRPVVLEFRDTGVGIPEEVRARIFEPYFITKESGKGTGLGLSVVHGIVESMRGEIAVRSAPGQGATFTVTLPTVPPAAAEPEKSK